MAITTHLRRHYQTTTRSPTFKLRQMLYQHPIDHPVAAFVTALQFSASTSSTITTAIDTYHETNSPVVASGAFTNLQIAAGGAPSLPSLLLLHHPRHCCLNSTTSTRPRLLDQNLHKWLIEIRCHGFPFTSVAACKYPQILDNQPPSIYFPFHPFLSIGRCP
jgi:hypothetical protein